MREIELTQGYKAIVDDEDFEALSQWKWHADVSQRVDSKYIKVRRSTMKGGIKKNIVMGAQLMNTPKGMICDHINGNSLDNRRQNLRNCSKAENCRNQTKTSAYNKSGFKGVRMRVSGRWGAQIKCGKTYYLGTFKDKVEAAIAYNEAAKRLHGEFASLNQII